MTPGAVRVVLKRLFGVFDDESPLLKTRTFESAILKMRHCICMRAIYMYICICICIYVWIVRC